MSVATPKQTVSALYLDHKPWLHGWLRRQLGNSWDAADLAHDTFISLLSRPQPAALREPRAYLATIAGRLVIRHWRRRALEQAWLATLAALPQENAPAPEARLAMLQALHAIDTVLDGLKPAVRTAFLCAQLEGLTCPQIAQRLGVSLATAERYIASALRHCLAAREGREHHG